MYAEDLLHLGEIIMAVSAVGIVSVAVIYRILKKRLYQKLDLEYGKSYDVTPNPANQS